MRRRRAPLNAGDLASLAITAGDFEAAVARVQPSVRREGFATTPDVTWADVGSLEEVHCLVAREQGKRLCHTAHCFVFLNIIRTYLLSKSALSVTWSPPGM